MASGGDDRPSTFRSLRTEMGGPRSRRRPLIGETGRRDRRRNASRQAPETAKSRRTVELDAGTVAGLRDWRKRQLEERLRAGEAWTPGEWIATNEIGAPLRPDYLGRRFSELAASLGLRHSAMKQLRHSHASDLLAAGEHPKVVQERLGHSSVSITLDTYSAVLPNMQREAVERRARTFDVRRHQIGTSRRL